MAGTARTSTRERLERREQDILRAATELFATAGFHSTSTRRIAAQAGVSEGTVFHYFGSKYELMLAILDRFYTRRLCTGAERILDDVMDTRERLQELASHHVRALAADQALMLRLLQVYIGIDMQQLDPAGQSPIRSLNRQYVAYLDRILREGIERGEIRESTDLIAFRDLYFGGLEYGMRTYLYRHKGAAGSGLGAHVLALVDPLWESISAAGNSASSPASTAGARLDAVAARLESAAQRLEKLTTPGPRRR
ncbi:MAG: TetR/AcrR family transcriptional regulator [Chromatocurvus sp.]